MWSPGCRGRSPGRATRRIVVGPRRRAAAARSTGASAPAAAASTVGVRMAAATRRTGGRRGPARAASPPAPPAPGRLATRRRAWRSAVGTRAASRPAAASRRGSSSASLTGPPPAGDLGDPPVGQVGRPAHPDQVVADAPVLLLGQAEPTPGVRRLPGERGGELAVRCAASRTRSTPMRYGDSSASAVTSRSQRWTISSGGHDCAPPSGVTWPGSRSGGIWSVCAAGPAADTRAGRPPRSRLVAVCMSVSPTAAPWLVWATARPAISYAWSGGCRATRAAPPAEW